MGGGGGVTYRVRPDPTPHGLVRAESDDPLWSGDAPQVYDASAIGATAIAVGENGGTPHEQDAAIPNVDAGSYRVLVRYRFSGTSPSQGYVRFNQTGQTQQSLDVPVVTPAATFDGTISYNGRSGYYNLGTVTLVAGTLNLKVVGPASTDRLRRDSGQASVTVPCDSSNRRVTRDRVDHSRTR